jgi:hypothetical protein
MNKLKIKALIINYNRLTLPMNMADYLFDCKIDPIFIDNNSTYKPLLDYYKKCKYQVMIMDKNYGHEVIWKNNVLYKLGIDGEYIVTDSDLNISKIPKNFLSVLRKGLDKYSKYEKCAFGLRINDLPKNKFSEFIINTEKGYWDRPLDDMYFDASTDTTFALYRTRIKTFNSIRTNEPYVAEHVPWYYTDLNNLPDDEKNYFKTINTSTYYSHLLQKK